MAWIITKDSQFYLHDNETLLAGLQRVGMVADFECQQGYCGTCKKKFKAMNEQTQLHYPSPPLVMLNDDEILPCCCYVKGVLALI